MLNSNFTVSWSLPRASKNDKIGILHCTSVYIMSSIHACHVRIGLYPLYGQTDVARATNRQCVAQGECTIKVTTTPY